MSYLKEKTVYDLQGQDKIMRVRLDRIEHSNSGMFPSTYIFKCFTPCKLMETSSFKNGFPLPEGVIARLADKFIEVTGKEAEEYLNQPYDVEMNWDNVTEDLKRRQKLQNDPNYVTSIKKRREEVLKGRSKYLTENEKDINSLSESEREDEIVKLKARIKKLQDELDSDDL